MTSSLPLATTGLRRPTTITSRRDSRSGTRPSSIGQNEDPLNLCAWARQGHRLWEAMPDSFWIYTYKVELCPFHGKHMWTACPYAHRRERARRRDPSLFPYAAAPCPEYAESKRRLRLAGSRAAPHCARGLSCGYAHGIFEMLLHPTRFRTQMCEGGADCSRRVCFFAHCLAQRRREDDPVPLVVFPATPPPSAFFIPRPAASASSSSVSRPRPRPRPCSHSQSVSIVARQVDRVTQAVQQGHSVRLLTRHSDAAGALSSSSSTSRAVVSTAAVAAPPRPRPLLQASPLLLQASPSPVDDEDIDFVPIVTGCRLAAEEDSNADCGHDYPHFDLIMDIVRS